MRSLLSLICLLLVSDAGAQATKNITKFEKLEESYNRTKRKRLDYLSSEYEKALGKLIRKYSVKGNLEGVIFLKKKLKEHVESRRKERVSSKKVIKNLTLEEIQQLRMDLVGKWNRPSGGYAKIYKGAWYLLMKSKKYPLTISSTGALIFQHPTSNKTVTLRFNKEKNQLEGTWFEGESTTPFVK